MARREGRQPRKRDPGDPFAKLAKPHSEVSAARLSLRATSPFACVFARTHTVPRSPHSSRKRRLAAFTLVELLVVTAIIGLLTGLLLPAVQAARESARQTQCRNNLRQIGIALLQYHDVHESFPVGCVEWRPFGNKTQRQLAWSAYLLPQLEQQSLYDSIDFSKKFDDAENAAAAATIVATYLCPTADPEVTLFLSGRAPCHFGGIFGERILSPNNPPKGVMLIDLTISRREIADGTAFTLILGEDSRFPDGEWINGRNIFDQAFPINAAAENENDMRSEHPGGAHGLACDGSVHFLSESLDLKVLAALCTRAGNEPIGDWR